MDGDIKRDDICFASEFQKFLERVPAWNTNQNKNPIHNENLIENNLSGHKRDRNKQERGTEELTEKEKSRDREKDGNKGGEQKEGEQIPLVNLFWEKFTEENRKAVLVVRQQIKYGNVIEKGFENQNENENKLENDKINSLCYLHAVVVLESYLIAINSEFDLNKIGTIDISKYRAKITEISTQ